MTFSLKQKIIAFVVFAGVLLIAIFQMGLGGDKKPIIQNKAPQTQEDFANDPQPRLVSIKPDSLEGATILPTQTIEVTFNHPLQNVPETKWRIDPKIEMKVELSVDKKIIKFTPTKAYDLGQGYNLIITGDTKFDNNKLLNTDYHWAFQTIKYTGI